MWGGEYLCPTNHSAKLTTQTTEHLDGQGAVLINLSIAVGNKATMTVSENTAAAEQLTCNGPVQLAKADS